MSNDPEWDKVAKQITAVTERMMRAGWITKTLRTSEGLGIDYTPEGMEKMKHLLELLRSLDLATMTIEDLSALQAIVRRFGSNTGDPPLGFSPSPSSDRGGLPSFGIHSTRFYYSFSS